MFNSVDSALLYLQQCLKQGENGKTLLVSFQAEQPQAAWAAGLQGSDDHASFATFAKFALQKLFPSNAYWLMLPIQLGDHLGYRVELKSPHACWYGDLWLEGDAWQQRETEAGALIDDLLMPMAKLPGIMRRDLEQLAYRLEIDTP